MATIGFRGKNIVDIIKYRFVWLGISAVLVLPCVGFIIYSLITFGSPVKLGIDFTGGTFLQYGFEQNFEVKDIGRIRSVLEEIGQGNAVIQIQEPADIFGDKAKLKEKVDGAEKAVENKVDTVANEVDTVANEVTETADKAVEATKVKLDDKKDAKSNVNKAQDAKKEAVTPEGKTEDAPVNAVGKTSEADKSVDKAKDDTLKEEVPADKAEVATKSLHHSKVKTVVSMRVKFLSDQEVKKLNALFRAKFGDFSIIQVSAIGPALGQELLTNSMIALLLVFGGIVCYLTVRFQFDYAVCALVALLHDAIFVIGLFAAFGIFHGTEVDSLFVTAVLTVIGFSVHDTIVVYDRIRENARFLSKKKSFNEICNDSVNQTLARSINTSMTTMLVLLCLFVFGGVTTRDFVFAMLVGIAIGTYSSIFNASVLLAMWREANAPKKRKRKVAEQ